MDIQIWVGIRYCIPLEFPKRTEFFLIYANGYVRAESDPKLLSKETQVHTKIMACTALENINLDCFKYK